MPNAFSLPTVRLPRTSAAKLEATALFHLWIAAGKGQIPRLKELAAKHDAYKINLFMHEGAFQQEGVRITDKIWQLYDGTEVSL